MCAGLLHGLGKDLVDEEGALEVDVQHLVKVLLCHLQHVTVPGDPSTVHNDVRR